jgi:NAD(P)H-hydrate epimerase
MRPVITPEESNRLDATATEPVATLMERAGYGLALAAVAMGATYGARVVVLAGAGNNGGDGYVAARYLAHRGVSVIVHALAPPKQPDGAAAAAARAAREAGVRIVEMAGPEPADLVVDAVFGVGFRGGLPEVLLPWVDHPAPVLAVDVPSGLDAATGLVSDRAFTATRTVTFHALKAGHVLEQGPDHCGVVDVVDIGLTGERPSFRLADADDAPRPPRLRTAHKWSAGSVGVVGGSPGITGAPMLAARSALAMGAGSVALFCPAALQPTYAAQSSEVMTRGIGKGPRFRPEDASDVLDAAVRFDVLVVGPGLGDGQREFVEALTAGWSGPLLLDADGLNALDGIEALVARRGPALLTPHAGEAQRLLGDAKVDTAARLPDRAGAIVLLKGSPTFVLGSERWAIDSGGRELATIGTGDVLAGVVAALWSRGLMAEVAARSGAYWHGIAARDLARSGTVTAEALAAAVRGVAWS